MTTFHASTLNTVLAALCVDTALTPREVEARVEIFGRSTIRAALFALTTAGRARVEGDIFQKRYRLRGTT